MARIETLRRLPEPPGNGHDLSEDAWASLSPELLDLLSAGDPPAYATDSRERIVFWNRGAAELLGRRSDETLGRHCFEVVCGRDLFGNRLCHQGCAPMTMARAEEPIRGFEMRVPAGGADAQPALLNVTILRIPGPRPDLFTLVHLLQPIDDAVLAARAAAPVTGAVARTGPATDAPFTRRETEVLRLVAGGLPNKDVAEKLGLSLATVRNHVHNMLEKAGVHSKLEMVSLAFRKGWA